MAKDPAFLFYPGDWLGGTLGMTFEEKGAYMEVLMLQFNRGHMEGHMVGQVVGQVWDKIRHKFQQDEKGLWYNVRLELEINRRKCFIDSRKNNLTGKNQHGHKEGRMGGHMTKHMENINVNESKDEIKDKGVQGEKEINHHLVELVRKEFPAVASMKKPLTDSEAEKLLQAFDEQTVIGIFQSMENYAKLKTNNISTYLTAKKWIEKDLNNQNGKSRIKPHHLPASEKFGGLSKDYVERTISKGPIPDIGGI